jgi:large-conductance mechanosensitive channel
MILIRFFLVSLIVYLVIRSFLRYFNEEESSKLKKDDEKNSNLPNKKISKEVGEYIDYEEIDKKN